MPGSAHNDAAAPPGVTSPESPAQEALEMMVEALRLIDLNGGATVAGAHLELAIYRLRDWIDGAEPK